jgi:hypothetical protein
MPPVSKDKLFDHYYDMRDGYPDYAIVIDEQGHIVYISDGDDDVYLSAEYDHD